MSKLHTPLIDDFVNELLGDDSELQDAANQDDHSSTKDQAVQTPAPAATQEQAEVEKPNTSEEAAQPSIPVTTDSRTDVDNLKPAPEPTEQTSTLNAETTAEPAEQTTIHAEPEVQAVEEISIEDNPAIEDHPDHTPTPAEIEATTVVEELANTASDDYAAATAIIENFKANVGNADSTNTETTNAETTEDQTNQTSTQDKSVMQVVEETPIEGNYVETEVEAVEELSVEDHRQEATDEPVDQTPIQAASEMQTVEELSVEDHPASTEDQTEQTPASDEFEAQAVEEHPSNDHNQETTGELSDQTPTHAETEVEAVEELSIEKHTQDTAPDPEDIAASVIADFDNEFPEQVAPEDHPASTEDQTEETSTRAEPEMQAAAVEDHPAPTEELTPAPDADAIAASVIADFDAEFPEDSTIVENAQTQPSPDPDVIAASVIDDFDAEFPDQAEQEVADTVPEETSAQPDPDAIAASVIEDFEAEFPEQAETSSAPEPASEPDPDAIAASVIADFESEFPETEPVQAEAAPETSLGQVNEPAPQPVPEIAAAPQADVHEEVTHDFPLDLQQWLQPPPLDDNEIEIVTYMRCVSFELQGQHYAAEVQTLLEVLDHADIVPIPSMRHPVLGILNLRGSIVPVIDPSTLLGLAPCTDTDTQLLVAEYDNEAVALPVSDVSEVVNVDQNDIQTAPQSAKHVLGLAPLGDEMLTLLDLKALINAILNR